MHVTTALHADEIPIELGLVRALVDGAFPEFASLDLRPLAASGSSNALFRLGDDLVVRLPRQPGGSASIEKEARWLSLIERHLSVAVPTVVAVGEPALGYPERWSVTRWIVGDLPALATSERQPPGGHALARDLAKVVNALRGIEVPDDALTDESLSSYRGGPLSDLDEDFRESVEDCRGLTGLDLDLDAVLRAWDDVLASSAPDLEPVRHWYHGDLLAENLLVRDGRLAAVLDFGGMAVGDPCVDLIAAWEVLDVESRELFRQAVAVDDATWRRSMGWALLISVITFPYYWETMPARCESRRVMAHAVLDALG